MRPGSDFVPELSAYLAFAALCFGLVLTPGPNMIYLVSRSLAQGWRAGAVSLAGIVVGFLAYMLAAALGLTAIALAVPFIYEAIKIVGALYLLWLAWQSVKPGGSTLFVTRRLEPAKARELLTTGFVTSLLNPKVALFYASLFPQFVDPERGQVLLQYITFGVTQIVISSTVNFLFILFAGSIAAFFMRNPLWNALQRYLMGTVLAALAVRMALDRR